MKSREQMAFVVIVVLLIWVFKPGGLNSTISYQPIGLPVEITIDSQGELSLSTEGVTDIPTPIGIFGVGVVADPTTYFDDSDHDIQNTLTIRRNGQDTIYNLDGKDVNRVKFEPGYYHAITLSWRGKDLLLEMVKLDMPAENPTANLTNNTGIAVSKFSNDLPCGTTAFNSGMLAIAVQAVNVRTSPEVPRNWNANWQGVVLQEGETVKVIEQPVFTDGYWLKVRRSSGEMGWVKECTPHNGALVAPK